MKPVFIGVLPTFTKGEHNLVTKLLFRKEKVDSLSQFQANLANVLPEGKIFLTDSGRSAFYLLLKSLDLPAESEVILPAFTCIVIVNPVLWAGLKPIYVDIQPDTLNPRVENILAHVTPKTKVILAQHTFGIEIDTMYLRSELDKIDRRDILIVEDLAHTLGSKSQTGKVMANNADAAITTFGYEKVFSTIRGGGLWINSNFKRITTSNLAKLQQEYDNLPNLTGRKLRQILFNPVFWRIVTPFYYLGIGRYTIGRLMVKLGHALGILGLAIDETEYSGGKPSYIPAKLHPKLAEIGSMQLLKLDDLEDKRRELVEIYAEIISKSKYANNQEQINIRELISKSNHTLLRYPIVLEDSTVRDKLVATFAKNRIVLGDWYKTMFFTNINNLQKIEYNLGSCPIAEETCRRIVNLPITLSVSKQTLRIISETIN